MNENSKVFFIINKYSGTEYQDSVEGRIIDTCGQLGIECVIEFTQGRGHATELAKGALDKKFTSVFAVGGDGTVNEVAQGLLHTDLPMAVLPKGSGNGLARHLGVPMKFVDALSLLKANKVIEMDTININGKLSVNVSGIGFDGHIAGLFGKDGKRGLAGYVKLVAGEFRTYQEFAGDVTVDSQPFRQKSFIIALANSSQFGNNATIAPQASVCDQLIDVCFIRKVPLTHAIGFAHKMFSGKLDRSSFVKIVQGKTLELSFPHDVAFHIDGEAQNPASHFSVNIQPRSLKMLVPAVGKKAVV